MHHKMARDAKLTDFFAKKDQQAADDHVNLIKDAHKMFYERQKPLGSSAIAKDRTQVTYQSDLKSMIRTVLRNVTSLYRDEKEAELDEKLKVSLNLAREAGKQKIRHLDNQDLLALNSDSDASQNECEVREIEMKNIIIDRLNDQ